jgi:hypothetical protein
MRLARSKNITAPPFYLAIAEALISGVAGPAAIRRVIKAEQRTTAELDQMEQRLDAIARLLVVAVVLAIAIGAAALAVFTE